MWQRSALRRRPVRIAVRHRRDDLPVRSGRPGQRLPELPAWLEHLRVEQRQRGELRLWQRRRLLRWKLRRLHADADETGLVRQLRHRHADVRERRLARRHVRGAGLCSERDAGVQHVRDADVQRELRVRRLLVPVHAGVRAGMFLPKERLEIGMSIQHQLQDDRLNRYGFHLQWTPPRTPFELRSEGAYSRLEGNGLWIEGAARFHNVRPSMLRRVQAVTRTQVFHTGAAPGANPDLPSTDTKRTEIGFNYYLNDGWKALASYGRTFTPLGDSNIWTVGMTYRFVIPLGPRQ